MPALASAVAVGATARGCADHADAACIAAGGRGDRSGPPVTHARGDFTVPVLINPAEHAESPGHERERQPGWRALLAVCLGFFIIQLDVTIVSVALPAIAGDVGGSVGGLQWIVDACTLAFAAVMLTAGSTADRLGARRISLIGLAVFAEGSAASAPALPVLIAARAVQGLGAAALLLPSSLALIVHQCPGTGARARALGLWGAMGSAAVALGPVAGGVLVENVGWRAIFAVNIPVCALTARLIARHVPESPAQRGRPADVPGRGAAVLAPVPAGGRAHIPGCDRAAAAAHEPGGRDRLGGRRQAHRQRQPPAADADRAGPRLPRCGRARAGRPHDAAVGADRRIGRPRPLLAGQARDDSGGCQRGQTRQGGPGQQPPERRTAGGALGVALPGALLTSGGGHAIALRTPVNVAAAGYVLAIGLAWLATRPRRPGESRKDQEARHVA